MNIGIDIRPLMSLVRTGVGEYTYGLLNAIFEIDKNNQYFLFYNSHADVSKFIPKWEQNNVHFVTTRWPNKLFNFSLQVFKRPRLDKLITKISRQNIDIFYSPNINFTSLANKTKIILTIHDLSFEFFPDFYSLKQRLWHKIVNAKKQCEQANVILTPSENTKKDIVEKYAIAGEKIKTLYPGLDSNFNTSTNGTQNIQQKYNLPEKFILFLGTLEPRKNIIGLIEAYEKAFPKLAFPCSLVIAGARGWRYKHIFQRIKSSPIKDQIKFIDYVDSADKPALYKAAELFVFPSFYEGFGFPVIEAMAEGTPVITSNRSSLPEITEGAALLTNPTDTSSLAEAMIKILNSTDLKMYFKNKGLTQATKFNWTITAKNWLNIVTNL
ncbi:MAG: glycosyltransferase family 1 protein [Patescibacteria group bacterium]